VGVVVSAASEGITAWNARRRGSRNPGLYEPLEKPSLASRVNRLI